MKSGNDEQHTPEDHTTIGPSSILLLAVWFGVLFGFAEVALLGILKFSGFAVARGISNAELGWRSGYIWLSPHVVWMAPVAAVCQLGLVGGLLVVLSRLKPSFVTLLKTVFVFAFVSFLSLLFVYQRLYDFAVVLLSAGLAVQTARLLNARSEAFLRIVKRWTPRMAAAVGVVAVTLNVGAAAKTALSLSRLPEVAAGTPNILLLILDTVRAANVSFHGYSRETTPNLERLAGQGVAFDMAIATAPWTLPSHVSIMTGRLPGEVSSSFLVPYDGEFPTLAEVLQEHGYETAAFVANRLYLGYETGIDRGFQRYDDYSVSISEFAFSTGLGRKVLLSPKLRNVVGYHDIVGRKDAAGVTGGVLDWLDSRSNERPFFAFLNYNDPHEPYLPPSPYDHRFGEPFPRRNDRSEYQMRRVVRTDRYQLSPRGVQAELDAYDGAINYVDAQIGVVLERLRRDDLLENTLVIVASDHGEHFGEHGLHVHGNSVFMPLLHVPLFFVYGERLPAGMRVPDPVSLREIPVTALDIAGVPDTGSFPGTSLARHWTPRNESGEAHRDSAIVSEYRDVTGNATAKSVVMGKYHYFWGWGLVRLTHSETGDEVWRDMRFEALYDLDADPDETHDLVPDTSMVGVLTDARRTLAPYLIRDRSYRDYLPAWVIEPGGEVASEPRR